MKRDEQNFESLQRLLTLKRHETPPPGYFDRFSRDVSARIKAGDRGDALGLVDWFSGDSSLFARLWAALEARPAAAILCGIATCGLLVSALVYSEKQGDSAPIAVFMAPEMAGGMEMASEAAVVPPGSRAVTPVVSTPGASSTSGMMPSSPQPDSLFNFRPALNVQPAGHFLQPGQ